MSACNISDINYGEGYDSRAYGYSQGVLVTFPQEILYISGQVGVLAPDEQRSFADQIDLAYLNMEKVLRSANMTFANVVQVRELVVGNSLEKLEIVNNKKKLIFNRFPASTYIPVNSLALPGMLFEIEAVAVK
ncbi:Endoribonuclease L-PSP [compost metagenome]